MDDFIQSVLGMVVPTGNQTPNPGGGVNAILSRLRETGPVNIFVFVFQQGHQEDTHRAISPLEPEWDWNPGSQQGHSLYIFVPLATNSGT